MARRCPPSSDGAKYPRPSPRFTVRGPRTDAAGADKVDPALAPAYPVGESDTRGGGPEEEEGE